MTARGDEVAQLRYSLHPDIAKAFLRRHVSDSTRAERLQFVATAFVHDQANDLDDMRRAVVALESTLDRALPAGELLMMVEFDANVGLDDASDAGARAWLEALIVDLRRELGAAAPPARGTDELRSAGVHNDDAGAIDTPLGDEDD